MKIKIVSNFSKRKDRDREIYRSNDMNIEHELKMRIVIKIIKETKKEIVIGKEKKIKTEDLFIGKHNDRQVVWIGVLSLFFS